MQRASESIQMPVPQMGGVAAVALFPKRAGEFAVLLKGNAKQLLPECISETDEILGL